MKTVERSLSASWQWIGIGISLVAITVLIYATESLKLPFFATLRYLYLIPISYVALNFGRRYGLAVALLVTSLFTPIFATVLMSKGWQAVEVVEMALTLVAFNVLAVLGGDMAERATLQKDRYRTLNHLSEQFSRELNVEELACVILAETRVALHAESGELWLCRSEKEGCRQIVQQGPLPMPLAGEVASTTADDSLVEWVLAHNTPLYCENPQVDPRFSVPPTQPPLRDVIATPLRRSSAPFGVLLFYNRQFRTFMARDADLLTDIALKSEAALERALLYQTLEEHVQQRTQDLAEEHNKLTVILQSIADGLAVLDREQYILMVNPPVVNFINRPAKTLIGAYAWDIFPSPALQAAVTRALAGTEVISTADVVLPTGRVLRASVGLLGGVGPDATGVVIVLRDVTQELEVDRMKTDFVSMVSHELRTPLTGVMGFAKLIQKQLSRFPAEELAPGNVPWAQAVQRIQDNLAVIITESQRLTHLIADVLDIAKMETGAIDWEMAEVALVDVIAQAVAATQAMAHEKGLTLEVEIADDIPMLFADYDRLVQVVENLLSNAIKFTDAGGVTVHLWRLAPGDDIPAWNERWSDLPLELPSVEPLLAVSVQDTGVGIAFDELPQVFEKFRQVGDRRTGTRRRGTGLGLPICREIIAHHDGQLWVESREGEGSRFVFTLPIQQD
ncbi:MAG TPA: ATP-binding protein [Anaerolineae bacterium]|nr:ATP-binding protein [Anaerolineae bacterium]